MKSASFAEWLLSRVLPPTEAATRTGDLLELSARRGQLWFWRAVVTNLAYAAARPALAIIAAYLLSEAAASAWSRTSAARNAEQHLHDLARIWFPCASILMASVALCTFALLRFGWRDPYARTTTLAGAAAFLLALGFAHPPLTWAAFASALLLTAILCSVTSLRTTALISLAQLGSACAILITGTALIRSYLRLCLKILQQPAYSHLARSFVLLYGSLIHNLLYALVFLLMLYAASRWRTTPSGTVGAA